MSFDSFCFDPRIVAGIEACGYKSPTAIQQQAIPAVAQGRDVMGLAQTGTGKTAAFVLPLLQRLLENNVSRTSQVRVLVLAPTRELALQIHEDFRALGRKTGLTSAAVFGGVGMNPQITALRRSQIIVACPGRLLDLINRGQADLSGVKALVLDEADRMLDMGFLPDIRRILDRLPSERQNLMFSATMPPEIRKLSKGLLTDPEVVQVANTAPAKRIRHAIYPVSTHLKRNLLEALIGQVNQDEAGGSVLVFTRTKHRAKSLAQRLDKLGFAAAALQGNMSQNARQKALDGFKRGSFKVLVATDIAARGIDCDRITHVINFDMPDSGETYTHRIGRTGRMEKKGTAMTLACREDMDQLRIIERTVGAPIASERLEGFDYQAAKPQGVGSDGGWDSRADNRSGNRSGGWAGKRNGKQGFAPQGRNRSRSSGRGRRPQAG